MRGERVWRREGIEWKEVRDGRGGECMCACDVVP